MHKKVNFTDQSIVDFCKITRDDNLIHNPEIMNLKGKQVVVPGMFIFAIAANMASEHPIKINSIKVFFSSMISRGDEISIGFEPYKNGVRLMAMNSKDCLSLNESHSLATYEYQLPLFDTTEGRMQSLKVEPWQMEVFSKLTGTHDAHITSYLFAIAYASKALNLSINDPKTEVEEEIYRLIRPELNPARTAPFYQSLNICFPKEKQEIEGNGTIDYTIYYIREKAHRSYIANVHCSQNGKTIYYSSYKMIAIPERLILRMFKDL